MSSAESGANPYRDLTMEQALARRDQIEEEKWRIYDLLEANRAEYGQICKYIYNCIQEGLKDE